MCGILYVKRDTANANKTVIKRYHKQRLRGISGFGYITIDKGKVSNLRRFEYENDMVKAIKQEESNEILFHHRTPTSTPNISETNHPILVENEMLDKKYYVIHNGIISNDLELKKEHEELGFKYTTEMSEETVYKTIDREIVSESTVKFNDSEVFAIDLALFLEGKSKKIKSKGSIAFICLETDKKDNIQKIHYGHNDKNPLVIEKSDGMLILKSEGKGEDTEIDTLYSLNYTSNELIEREVNIGDDYRWSKPVDNYDGYNGKRKQIGFTGMDDYRDDDEIEKYYNDKYNNGDKVEFRTEYVDELYERYQELEESQINIKADLDVLKLQIESGVYKDQEEADEWLEEMNVELEDVIDEMKDINYRIVERESTKE